MRNQKINNTFFLAECTVYGVLASVFLVLGVSGSVSPQAANIIYICTILFLYGYLFVLDFFLKKYDNAVHFKMFSRYYVPAGNGTVPVKRKRTGLEMVVLLWLYYLMTVALLRKAGILTWYLFLACACGVMIFNSIFVRKVCLLSVLFLHNRNDCCKNCGINNWDYAIFSSALFFAPKMSVAATAVNITIIVLSFALMIAWEITYRRHPERFYPETNKALRCSECLKQCQFRSDVL